MNIPEKAIEAAALLLHKDDNWGKPEHWPTQADLAEGRSIFDPAPTLEEFKQDYVKLAAVLLEAAAPFIAAQAAKAERERIAEEIHIQRFNKSGPDSFYWGITTAERIACAGDHPGMIHAQAVRAIEENPNA